MPLSGADLLIPCFHRSAGGFEVKAHLQHLLYAKFLTLEAVDVAMIPNCKEEFQVAVDVHAVRISSSLWSLTCTSGFWGCVGDRVGNTVGVTGGTDGVCLDPTRSKNRSM